MAIVYEDGESLPFKSKQEQRIFTIKLHWSKIPIDNKDKKVANLVLRSPAVFRKVLMASSSS